MPPSSGRPGPDSWRSCDPPSLSPPAGSELGASRAPFAGDAEAALGRVRPRDPRPDQPIGGIAPFPGLRSAIGPPARPDQRVCPVRPAIRPGPAVMRRLHRGHAQQAVSHAAPHVHPDRIHAEPRHAEIPAGQTVLDGRNRRFPLGRSAAAIAAGHSHLCGRGVDRRVLRHGFRDRDQGRGCGMAPYQARRSSARSWSITSPAPPVIEGEAGRRPCRTLPGGWRYRQARSRSCLIPASALPWRRMAATSPSTALTAAWSTCTCRAPAPAARPRP
jgi:hypothetical protein